MTAAQRTAAYQLKRHAAELAALAQSMHGAASSLSSSLTAKAGQPTLWTCDTLQACMLALLARMATDIDAYRKGGQ